MTELDVAIEFLVPAGADAGEAIALRETASARSVELGWPEPHSGGVCFAYDNHLVSDLAWALPPGVDPQPVLAILEREFYIRSLRIYDEAGRQLR